LKGRILCQSTYVVDKHIIGLQYSQPHQHEPSPNVKGADMTIIYIDC